MIFVFRNFRMSKHKSATLEGAIMSIRKLNVASTRHIIYEIYTIRFPIFFTNNLPTLQNICQRVGQLVILPRILLDVAQFLNLSIDLSIWYLHVVALKYMCQNQTDGSILFVNVYNDLVFRVEREFSKVVVFAYWCL